MPTGRQRWVAGSIIKIPLPDGSHTYGVLRKVPLVSIFDARTKDELEPVSVAVRPVLFSVCVMARAMTVWPRVGSVPLTAWMERVDSFVKRDRISGRVTTYTEGQERPSAPAERETLEVAAVWDPEHIVDRVSDHYAGRPNKWTRSLRNLILTGDGRVSDL